MQFIARKPELVEVLLVNGVLANGREFDFANHPLTTSDTTDPSIQRCPVRSSNSDDSRHRRRRSGSRNPWAKASPKTEPRINITIQSPTLPTARPFSATRIAAATIMPPRANAACFDLLL